MYRKILVPLDGSATSQRGFEEAVALARALKSALVLLHVVDVAPVPMDVVTPDTLQQLSLGLRQHGEQLLQRASRTAKEHGVSVETRLAEQRAERVADIIVAEARDTGCDVVVMGTHGRRGFSHALLGSDAERVVRECPVPVLLVRHAEAKRG